MITSSKKSSIAFLEVQKPGDDGGSPDKFINKNEKASKEKQIVVK